MPPGSGSQTDNFLDIFIVVSDFLGFVACWKQICSGMGQDVALEEWLSPFICHGRCRCQPAGNGALSPTAQTWGAAPRNLETPGLEIPSEKKNGSQGGFVHKMRHFCPFYP